MGKFCFQNRINLILILFKSAHSSVKAIGSGASRHGAFLDEIYTNMHSSVIEKLVQKPLSKPNGVESDHHVISASIKLPKAKKSTIHTFTFRPITTEGVEAFGKLLVNYDWLNIKKRIVD